MIARQGRRSSSGTAAQLTTTRNEWRAGKPSRFRSVQLGVAAQGIDADREFRSDAEYFNIVALGRHYEINDRYISSGIRRLVTNVLQGGMTLNPQTGDNGLDKDIKDWFHEWADAPLQCDIRKRLNFRRMVRLALRRIIVDGDVFFLPLEDGRLQMLESHRVRNPAARTRIASLGVQTDGFGAPIRYFVTRRELPLTQTTVQDTDLQPYDAFDSEGNPNVFHVYDPYRTSINRGISAFAPIPDDPCMIDDTLFALLVKQQSAACFGVMEERPLTDDDDTDDLDDFGVNEIETLEDGFSRTVLDVGPGMIYRGKPGRKLTAFSPNIPSPETMAHLKAALQVIAINLNLPIQVLLLDAADGNLSQWRGTMDQARMTFREMHDWLIASLHRPVYEWKIRQRLATDKAFARASKKRGINVFKHIWNAESYGYIDPLKDAMAEDLQLSRGLRTPLEIHGGRGRDWEEVHQEITDCYASAVQYAIQKAAEINAALASQIAAGGAVPVTWRDLIRISVPDGMTVNIQPEAVT